MKLAKLFTLLIAASAVVGSAQANTIVDLGTFSTSSQDPGGITTLINANGGDTGVLPDDMDLVNAGRIVGASGGTLTNSFGTFTVTIDAMNVNHFFLTFTTNPGFVLGGVAIHAGNGQNDELFSVNDETSGVNEGPFFGPGANATLSNFDIFVEEGAARTPDSGSTVMLLGAVLGLGEILRRAFVKRAVAVRSKI